MSHYKYKRFALIAGLIFGLLSFDAVSVNYYQRVIFKDYDAFYFPTPHEWSERVIGYRTQWTCNGAEILGCDVSVTVQTMMMTMTTVQPVVAPTSDGYMTLNYYNYYCEAGAKIILIQEMLIIPPECMPAIA